MSQEIQTIDSLLHQGHQVREELLRVSTELTQTAQEFALPAPSQQFIQAYNHLAHEECTIVVAGEAKRAKTSWINGLIGKPLLPVSDTIATCQAFSIRKASEARYGLRFEDDSYQEITEADLARYGSQEIINAEGDALLDHPDKVLRWIEMETPGTFLPDNVQFIDTPGMGSLYASHAEVTQRFVPLAHGVVFVLSDSEIIQDELAFIERLLQITPYIFFIQTRIDLWEEEKWKNIMARHEEILKKHFKDKLLLPVKVWPVSNKNMAKAANQKNKERTDEWLDMANYPALKEAFQLFLFQAAIYHRCCALALTLKEYFEKNAESLQARYNAITSSQNEQLQLLKKFQDRLAALERDFGPQSTYRREIDSQLTEDSRALRAQIVQDLSPAGDIFTKFKLMIESKKETKHLDTLNKTFPDQVAEEANQRLSKLFFHFQSTINEQLNVFEGKIQDAGDWRKDVRAALPQKNIRRPELIEHFSQANRGLMVGGAVAGTAATAVCAVVAAVGAAGGGAGAATAAAITTTVAAATGAIVAVPVAILAGAAYGAVKMWKKSRREALQATKQHMLNELRECLQQFHRIYFDTDYLHGKKEGLVNTKIRVLTNSALSQIDNFYIASHDELHNEIASLENQLKQGGSEQKPASHSTRMQLEKWLKYQSGLIAAYGELEKLTKALEAENKQPKITTG